MTEIAWLRYRAHWLLMVDIGGTVFRWSVEPVSTTDRSGAVDVWAEGLSEVRMGQATATEWDAEVGIQVSAGDTWRAVVEAQAVLEGARATLYRWREDQVLDDAEVVFSGRVEGLAYNGPLDPVTFSIARRVRLMSSVLPAPTTSIDADTYPVRSGWTTDERCIGAHGAIVIGAPGDDGSGTPKPAVPVHLVETDHATLTTDRGLVACHRCGATSVQVWDYTEDAAPETAAINLDAVANLTGRVDSLVQFAGGEFSTNPESGRQLWAGFAASGGGGLQYGGRLLRGAGDVIEWALRTWTDYPLDAARFEAVRELLNGYLVDTYINAPVDAIEWLEAVVLPILPVDRLVGEDGMYFVRRGAHITDADVVAEFSTETGGIERETRVQWASDSIINEASVEYAPDRGGSGFRGLVVVGASASRRADELQADIGADARILASYRARVSQARYGRRTADGPIQLAGVWDRTTAEKVARDIIDEQALPHRYVEYSSQRSLERIRRGMVIKVTDPEVMLDGVTARVLDVVRGGPSVTMSLELVDDPTSWA